MSDIFCTYNMGPQELPGRDPPFLYGHIFELLTKFTVLCNTQHSYPTTVHITMTQYSEPEYVRLDDTLNRHKTPLDTTNILKYCTTLHHVTSQNRKYRSQHTTRIFNLAVCLYLFAIIRINNHRK